MWKGAGVLAAKRGSDEGGGEAEARVRGLHDGEGEQEGYEGKEKGAEEEVWGVRDVCRWSKGG